MSEAVHSDRSSLAWTPIVWKISADAGVFSGTTRMQRGSPWLSHMTRVLPDNTKNEGSGRLRDRMESDEFLLTQEFLAMMLGVQRAGVTVAANALQRAGLNRYKRGNVTITDRRGLEHRSCECYRVSKMEFDRLLGSRMMDKRGQRK